MEKASRIKARIALDDNSGFREIELEVLHISKATDAAILKIITKTPSQKKILSLLKPLKMGDSDAVREGEFVLAIGNPHGQGQTKNRGMISNTKRSLKDGLRDTETGRSYDHYFLQVDVAINPGNSGGPLINLAGEVIGINVAILAGAQGMSYAIPINIIKEELKEIQTENFAAEAGWIGLEFWASDPGTLRYFKHSPGAKGIIIGFVEPDSPAKRAGLAQGDLVTHINNEPTDKRRDFFQRKMSRIKLHEKIKLTIIKPGREPREIIIQAEKKPEN